MGDDSHAEQFGNPDVFLIFISTTAAPTDSDSPDLQPRSPKIDAGAGGVRSAGWVKKADLTEPKTPKIEARGYLVPVSKDQVRSALLENPKHKNEAGVFFSHYIIQSLHHSVIKNEKNETLGRFVGLS